MMKLVREKHAKAAEQSKAETAMIEGHKEALISIMRLLGYGLKGCPTDGEYHKRTYAEAYEIAKQALGAEDSDACIAFPMCTGYEELREQLKTLPDTWYPDLLAAMAEAIWKRPIFKEPDGLFEFLQAKRKGLEVTEDFLKAMEKRDAPQTD